MFVHSLTGFCQVPTPVWRESQTQHTGGNTSRSVDFLSLKSIRVTRGHLEMFAFLGHCLAGAHPGA